MGQIGFGGSTSRSSALPSGGSAEHWYTVSFANSGANYHPHVYLAAGGAYYVIDVFRNCGGANPYAIGTSNWETTNQVTLVPGTTVWVRVRAYTANSTCQSYTVVFLNG